MYVYIQSTTNPAVRFQVVEYDKESGTGKLKGGYGTVITRNISKAELEKRGYTLVKSDVELDLTPPPVKGKPKVGEKPAPTAED